MLDFSAVSRHALDVVTSNLRYQIWAPQPWRNFSLQKHMAAAGLAQTPSTDLIFCGERGDIGQEPNNLKDQPKS